MDEDADADADANALFIPDVSKLCHSSTSNRLSPLLERKCGFLWG